MRASGMPPPLIRCFRSFYSHLRQRFRYGHVDGSSWSMANGLAQGCPASPDLLNLLFEPFHRWASAQGVGVLLTAALRVASSSFADDVGLIATSLQEVALLVQGYRDWCALLGLNIHLGKTQIWFSGHHQSQSVTLALRDGPLELTIRPTFRIVGVELGLDDSLVSAVHAQPRIDQALLAGKRLTRLDLPAGLAASLWRPVVVPQALYGCEVRTLPKHALHAVAIQGRLILPVKPPLQLSSYRAAEVVCGLPLGACAVQDPFLEMQSRRLRWFWTLANQEGLVGTLHRLLATVPGPAWVEPTPALAAALQYFKWKVAVNRSSPRAVDWPHLTPEPSYPGTIALDPLPDLPPAGSAWTDGSIRDLGGAAAVQPDTGGAFLHTSRPPPALRSASSWP